jgi:poly(hydroxyalkanoate) depolymerase family esterase
MQLTKLNYWVTAIALICSLPFAGAQQLTRIQNFGSNPGNLKMYVYTPAGFRYKRANTAGSGIARLPSIGGCCCQTNGLEQTSRYLRIQSFISAAAYIKQSAKCFCWYQRSDIEKGKGESFSIKQMIDEVKRTNAIDSTQVFITGLSAGAAMGVALMADYPETFNAGAIFAGGAYKTATNIWTGVLSLYGWRIKSPEKWGALVREQNPNYKGEYPRMIIYQGKADVVVNKRNGSQLMKQWTNLHGLSTTPTETIRRFAGAKAIEKNIYRTNEGKEAVLYYRIKHLGHALLVDPGKCLNQGRQARAV